MKKSLAKLPLLLIALILLAPSILKLPSNIHAQSGRNTGGNEHSEILNVIVHNTADESATTGFTKDQILLFDGGIQQDIEYLRVDPTGARLVLMVDSSQNLRAESPQVQKIIAALIGQLQDGDDMMLIGYANEAEIFADFTRNAKTLQAGAAKLKRDGLPKLYDALSAVVEDAFRKQLGVTKRAIVLISDGYDRDSKTKYEAILSTLLTENIIVYAFQVPDRTYGAIRSRESGPKPADTIRGLVESTGGQIFGIDKPAELANDAKQLVSELRDNWFTLAYTPHGINTINSRRLLLTSSDEKLVIRTKKVHPAQSR